MMGVLKRVGRRWLDFCDIFLNVIHGSSNIFLCRHVLTLCSIHDHISVLSPEIHFGLLYHITFEFEDGLYSYECNAQVMLYTQYIADVTQDVIVVLQAFGFNYRTVPYVRVRLGRQEPNVI